MADRYDEGLPLWEETAGLMNISTILWLRNLAIGWDLVEYARMRYNLLGNAGSWFAGLHAAGIRDFDITASIQRSPFAKQIPTWLAETHELLYRAPEKRLSQT